MKRLQLRAARAVLGWSQERLSQASGVSLPTIKRLEPGDEPMRVRLDTVQKLRATLESAGVDFIDENGEGPGVRLRPERDAQFAMKPSTRSRSSTLGGS